MLLLVDDDAHEGACARVHVACMVHRSERRHSAVIAIACTRTLAQVPWIGPDTLAEKTFTSFMVMLGAIMFAALLGDITGIVQANACREPVACHLPRSSPRSAPHVNPEKDYLLGAPPTPLPSPLPPALPPSPHPSSLTPSQPTNDHDASLLLPGVDGQLCEEVGDDGDAPPILRHAQGAAPTAEANLQLGRVRPGELRIFVRLRRTALPSQPIACATHTVSIPFI